jgi:hypothetical protein
VNKGKDGRPRPSLADTDYTCSSIQYAAGSSEQQIGDSPTLSALQSGFARYEVNGIARSAAFAVAQSMNAAVA